MVGVGLDTVESPDSGEWCRKNLRYSCGFFSMIFSMESDPVVTYTIVCCGELSYIMLYE